MLKGHLQCLPYNVSPILFFSKSTEVILLCSLYRHTPLIFKLLLARLSRQLMAQHEIVTASMLCGPSWIYSPWVPLLFPTHCSVSSNLSQGDVHDSDTICPSYFQSSGYCIEHMQKFIYTCTS